MKQTLVALVMTLITTAAFAQKTAPAPTKQTQKSAQELVTDDCARATKLGKKCVMNMEGMAVGGDSPGASGTSIGVITPGKQPSMIRIRKDFIAEMIKSTEDLD